MSDCVVGEVISVEAPYAPNGATHRRILDAYEQAGFALFEFVPEPADPAESVVTFAHALGLGSPFVPSLYSRGAARDLYDAAGVNVLSPALGRQHGETHPAFESSAALELHCDGTLSAIGEIPTAVLFCVTPAVSGGDTTLFRAADAFVRLSAARPDLANALCDRRALRRCATVNNSTDTCEGPVFAIRDGRPVSRYSVTPRDQWAFDDVPGLREAYSLLARDAALDSPFAACVRLGPLQGVLLANDKVSHGRRSFEDAVPSRRMLRALFLKRPSECVDGASLTGEAYTEATVPKRL